MVEVEEEGMGVGVAMGEEVVGMGEEEVALGEGEVALGEGEGEEDMEEGEGEVVTSKVPKALHHQGCLQVQVERG